MKRKTVLPFFIFLFFFFFLRRGGEKVVVVMVSDFLPTEDYIYLTSQMNYKWAEKRNYGFKFVHRERCSHRRWGERLKFWCRQVDFLSILNTKEWDWLFYVDGDAIINKNINFDDILKKATGEFTSPRDMWFNGSYLRQTKDPHVILSKDVDGWPGTCFGVQIWRNSPISKKIMCELFNSGINETRVEYPSGRIEVRRNIQKKLFAEQGVMNQFLSEGRWGDVISILPAEDLYLGGFVLHATLGTIVNGKRCSLREKYNCIKSQWVDGENVKINPSPPAQDDLFC